ncbi:MAG: hypothetical protein SCARUB_01186 [Candidatus Scalindua rubra]|uniref:Uncharacterized protein n=1 Tax=Candidatus Scalindua rubra TaxID=1872076 RepID=A0A1E3XDF9_9BACT|nr:MAG: hypothetical protein SCARUB_01186 [Candidatus Scalindua rubra]
MLYVFYRDGHLLHAGGVGDQPAEFLEAMLIVKSEVNKLGDGGKIKDSGNQNHNQNRNQSIGEYCKGVDLEKCKKYWGERILYRICETCPN